MRCCQRGVGGTRASGNHQIRIAGPRSRLAGASIETAGFNHRPLASRLLASITAPSLRAQTDQRFHWLLLTDDKLPRDIRDALERIIQPWGDRAFIHEAHLTSPAGKPQLSTPPPQIVRTAQQQFLAPESRHLLTGRIDDDDAWSTEMVGAVGAWLGRRDRAPGLSLSFQDGLEWIMYEMVDQPRTPGREPVLHSAGIRGYRQPFISMSVFVCSEMKGAATAMGPHSDVAKRLSTRKGYETDVFSTETPMWLCCRHKQAGSGFSKARGAEVAMSLPELGRRFGLDVPRVQRYLDDAERYPYTRIDGPLTRKSNLVARWDRATQALEDPSLTPSAAERLRDERAQLVRDIEGLETGVLEEDPREAEHPGDTQSPPRPRT